MIDEKDVLYIFTSELRKRLQSSGMTYRELAFKARCVPSRVQMYLRGNNFPNLWTLVLMAESLGCCVDDLLGYKRYTASNLLHTDSPFERFTNEFDFALYFKECLRNQMLKQNADQEKLAEFTGISERLIYQYLSPGYPMPHVAQVLTICSALDCTPSDLLGY